MWSIFDTLNICNSKSYQPQEHVNRLLFSVQQAKISISVPESAMSEKILDMINLYPNARIRFFSFWFNFYILAYTDESQQKPIEIEKANATDPPKPKILASIKKNNYLSKSS